MSVLVDVFLIILFFFLFGFSHSYFASNRIKQLILRKHGNYIAFYRIIYNIFSFITFYLIYKISPRPDLIIYDLEYPFDIIIFILQAVSLLGLIWTGFKVDWKEFLGISQIVRWYNGEYKIEDLDDSSVFLKKGPYKLSRHPIYLFTIIFLALCSTMDMFYLVFLVCIVIYFYIGSFFEEKKLLGKFGKDYSDYMKNVPRIFPRVIK